MADPQRIALVRLSHLGDVVLTLPLFHALRERFPGARLAWVVQSEFAGLVAGLEGLERVLRFERRGGARAWLALRRQLAEFDAEVAIDAQGNWKSAMATLASGAARRIGLAARDWRERWAWLAVNERATPALGEHAMERTRALCAHLLERPVADAELRRDCALDGAERERGRARLDELVGRSRAPLVLLQLSDSEDVRAWPLAHALELARSLAAQGTAVLVLSGPSEAAAGREAALALAPYERVFHWVAQRGLRELAAVFEAAAERGARYVGGDTGPTHLAAACGLHVTLLAGPQSHLRTGPWPLAALAPTPAPRHGVVRNPAPPDCAPCLARTCRRREGPVCMRGIEPAHVLDALLRT